MEKWYQTKGFKSNPLNIEAEFKDKLYGYDILIEELFYRVNSGNMIFLEGNNGKTALLYKVIEKYKGKGKVAYVDCNKIIEDLDIKQLITNSKKYMKQNFSGLPNNMILLLDNMNSLSNKNSEMLKYYFDQNNIQSIVMASTSYDDCEIPESIRHRIGNRIYKTKDLTEEELVELTLERLKYGTFITENQVEKIVHKIYKDGFKKVFQEIDAALFLMSNAHEVKMTDGIVSRLLHMPQEERSSYNI